MDFPKRIKQHKSQSDSFAILLYKLKDLGIFRSATENDYGIDFEIEITHGDRVIGRYLKAQVKSAEEVYVREDGIPTVGGIKQSTLLYWTELCFRSHVIVFAVDLKTEQVYFTDSIFWQATLLIDKSNSTRTISFRKQFDTSQLRDKSENLEPDVLKDFENFAATQFIKRIAYESCISDVIFAHKTLLRNIHQLFELYTDAWHYDYGSELELIDMFKTFLECSKLLVNLPEELAGLDSNDRKNMFNFSYWGEKTGWGGDEITNCIAQIPLKVLMPLVLEKLEYYGNVVLNGKYYWQYKDLPYLKMVHQTKIPTSRTHEEIVKLSYREYNVFSNTQSFYTFLNEKD